MKLRIYLDVTDSNPVIYGWRIQHAKVATINICIREERIIELYFKLFKCIRQKISFFMADFQLFHWIINWQPLMLVELSCMGDISLGAESFVSYLLPHIHHDYIK